MDRPRLTKGAAHEAARMQHQLAHEEEELADLERRAAAQAPTPWQRSAHSLAAEVHDDAAHAHERLAKLHDLEEDVERRGLL